MHADPSAGPTSVGGDTDSQFRYATSVAISDMVSSREPVALLQMLQKCVRSYEAERGVALLRALVRQSDLASKALASVSTRPDSVLRVKSAIRGLLPPVMALLLNEQEEAMKAKDVKWHFAILQLLTFITTAKEMPVESQVDDVLGLLVTSLVHQAEDDSQSGSNLPGAAIIVPTSAKPPPDDSKARLQSFSCDHSDIYQFDAGGLRRKVGAKHILNRWQDQARLRMYAARAVEFLLSRVMSSAPQLSTQVAGVLLKVALSPNPERNTYLTADRTSTLPYFDGDNRQLWLPAMSASTFGAVLGVAATGPQQAFAALAPIAPRLLRILDTFLSLPCGYLVHGASYAWRSPWLALTLQVLQKVVSAASVDFSRHPDPPVKPAPSLTKMARLDRQATIQVALIRKLQEAIADNRAEGSVLNLEQDRSVGGETIESTAPKSGAGSTRASKRKPAAGNMSLRGAGKRTRGDMDSENLDEDGETAPVSSKAKRSRAAVTSTTAPVIADPLDGVSSAHVFATVGAKLVDGKFLFAVSSAPRKQSTSSFRNTSVAEAIDQGELSVYGSRALPLGLVFL
jgi:hypothetical protein